MENLLIIFILALGVLTLLNIAVSMVKALHDERI